MKWIIVTCVVLFLLYNWWQRKYLLSFFKILFNKDPASTEKLVTERMKDWAKEIIDTQRDCFMNCLKKNPNLDRESLYKMMLMGRIGYGAAKREEIVSSAKMLCHETNTPFNLREVTFHIICEEGKHVLGTQLYDYPARLTILRGLVDEIIPENL